MDLTSNYKPLFIQQSTDIKDQNEDQRINTQQEAVLFLRSKGYKCSQTKISEDLKKHLIPKTEDGKFSAKALIGYAELHLDVLEVTEDKSANAVAYERLQAEADFKKSQADLNRLKLERQQGSLISKADHEEDLAARSAFFKREIETFIQRKGFEIIELVKGNPGCASDLIIWWRESMAGLMDTWSKDTTFEVSLEVAEVSEDKEDSLGDSVDES
jgi:hypothetical protein